MILMLYQLILSPNLCGVVKLEESTTKGLKLRVSTTLKDTVNTNLHNYASQDIQMCISQLKPYEIPNNDCLCGQAGSEEITRQTKTHVQHIDDKRLAQFPCLPHRYQVLHI